MYVYGIYTLNYIIKISLDSSHASLVPMQTPTMYMRLTGNTFLRRFPYLTAIQARVYTAHKIVRIHNPNYDYVQSCMYNGPTYLET